LAAPDLAAPTMVSSPRCAAAFLPGRRFSIFLSSGQYA
jgi:hypothetical protein